METKETQTNVVQDAGVSGAARPCAGVTGAACPCSWSVEDLKEKYSYRQEYRRYQDDLKTHGRFKKFHFDGYDCFAIRQETGDWNGYVGIPKGHALYRVNYLAISGFNCHGGLTGSYESQKHKDSNGVSLWLIGFDTGHIGDWRRDEFDVVEQTPDAKPEAERYAKLYVPPLLLSSRPIVINCRVPSTFKSKAPIKKKSELPSEGEDAQCGRFRQLEYIEKELLGMCKALGSGKVTVVKGDSFDDIYLE